MSNTLKLMCKSRFWLVSMLLLFCFLSLFAQNTVVGEVIDEETLIPVPYASVSLSLSDSSLNRHVITDEKGEFVFEGISPENYLLQFSCAGYQRFDTVLLVEGDSLMHMVMPPLKLKSERKEIQEIQVLGKQKRGKTGIDRTVYSITNDMLSSSVNGLDVLTALPSVDVSINNAISIKGSRNIKIFIDSKERTSADVAQLQPSEIKRLEIIHTPSLRYGADLSSVMNIVLKRDTLLGFKGNVLADAPLSKHMVLSHTGKVELARNKHRVYAGLYSFLTQIYRHKDFDRIADDYMLYQVGDYKKNHTDVRVNTGWDYFINDQNTVNVHYSNSSLYNTLSGTENLVYENQFSPYQSKFLTSSDYASINHELSTFYKKNFKNSDREIVSEIRLLNGFNEDDYVRLELDDSLSKTNVLGLELIDINKQSINLNTNFSNTVDDTYSYDIGGRYYRSKVENETSYELEDVKEKMTYNKSIAALYSSLSLKLGSYRIQSGVRLEYSNTDFGSSKNEGLYVLPQFNASREIGDNVIVCSYSKTIRRPSVFELYPFVNSVDSFNLYRGNADLEVVSIHKFRVAYTYEKGGAYLSPQVYYKSYTNLIEEISQPLGEQGVEYFPINIGKAYKVGIATSISVKPIKWLAINSYVDIHKLHVSASQYLGNLVVEELNAYSLSGSLRFTFLLPKDISIRTFLSYSSPSKTVQEHPEASLYYMLSVNKKIWDKGKISFISNMPFSSKYYVSDYTRETGSYTDHVSEYIKSSSYLMALRFLYSFGVGAKIKSSKRRVKSDKETKSVGGF